MEPNENKSSAKKVHLSWAEAVKAEGERERARKAACKPIPDAIPLQRLISKYLSVGLTKIKRKSWHLPHWPPHRGHTGSW